MLMQTDFSPIDHIEMTTLAQMQRGGSWRMDTLHSYNDPILYWITRGQGRMVVSGKMRGYGPSNAVFLPAKTMHSIDLGPQCYGLAVTLPSDPLMTLPSTPQPIRVANVPGQSELTGLLDNLQRELVSDRPAHTRAARFHAGLISVWLERNLPEPTKPDAAERLVTRYCDLIEKRIDEGLNVEGYAAALDVTPTHLTRSTQACCAMSALELLTERVTHAARRRLTDTSMTIKAVSESLGFNSAAYFTRSFQAQTGLTPSAFRDAA